MYDDSHILNAKSAPHSEFVEADGTYKTQAEVKRMLEEKGFDLAKPIVTSCKTGVNATFLTPMFA